MLARVAEKRRVGLYQVCKVTLGMGISTKIKDIL